jgi:hypothetical protein
MVVLRRIPATRWLLPAVVLLLAGCGKRELVPLTGKVTLDGQPLPTALVVFHPEADGSSGYGSVDTDGSYYAKTGSQTGLKPGKYRITVVANKPEVVNYQAGPKVPTPITPTRYASPETSGFVVTLTDSGATYDLELKGK